jgi:hypothetical protein
VDLSAFETAGLILGDPPVKVWAESPVTLPNGQSGWQVAFFNAGRLPSPQGVEVRVVATCAG